MSLSGYNINPLMGNYDWASLMSNPYFQYAWQTPNVNFKGGSQPAQAGASASAQYTGAAAGAQAVDGGIPVTPSAGGESGGSSIGTLATVGGLTVLGGGALYYLKKGNLGKAGKAIKSLLGGKSAEEAGKEAIRKLTAVKNKSGEMRFMIPGKTTTLKGEAAAKTFADENCIREAISLQRQQYNWNKSAIESFTCVSGADNYAVKVENGVITSIKDKDGKEILKELQEAATGTPEAKKLNDIENIFKEIKKEKDVNMDILSGVSNIGYRNTNGDDVLRMTMARYGEAPTLEEFTTLQRFKFTDPEMQAFKLSADEKVFADSRFFKDGKLIDGVNVKEFSHDIGGGNIGHFEGRTLVSITDTAGNVLPADSAGYIALAEKYEKDINKLVKRVFEKREYIPQGATLTTG